MSISAISPAAIAALQGPQVARTEIGGGSLQGFNQFLADSIKQANSTVQSADTAINTMVESQGANLHETMIAIERADITSRLTIRVGQKLVQAYKEISQMQV